MSSTSISSPSKCEACSKKAIFFSRAQQLAQSPDKYCSQCAALSNISAENDENDISPIEYPSEADVSDTTFDDNTHQLDNKSDKQLDNKSNKNRAWSTFFLFWISIMIGVAINYSIKFFKSNFVSKFLT
jgi:hypothetical protein